MQPDFLSLLERAGAARGLPTLAPSLPPLSDVFGAAGSVLVVLGGGHLQLLGRQAGGLLPAQG